MHYCELFRVLTANEVNYDVINHTSAILLIFSFGMTDNIKIELTF